MSKYSRSIPMIAVLSCCSLLPAAAQQGWINNTAGQIQQDAGAGLINSGQAAALQNRDAQIQAQEQQYLNQNGGKLTGQERRQINGELRNLDRHMGSDIRRDNPTLTPSSFPAVAPGFVPPNAGWQPRPQTGWPMPQNGWQSMPQTGWQPMPQGTLTPAQYQTTNPNYSQQPYHHHHHHNGAWGQNGYGQNGYGQNGYGQNYNPQYSNWGH